MCVGHLVGPRQDGDHSHVVLSAAFPEVVVDADLGVLGVQDFQDDLGIGQSVFKVGDVLLDEVVLGLGEVDALVFDVDESVGGSVRGRWFR